VRDKNFIWCEGTLKLIIEAISREPLYVVHYEGFAQDTDEVLFRNSSRLARPGTYTLRSDIPRYKFDEVNKKSPPQVENKISLLSDLNLAIEKED